MNILIQNLSGTWCNSLLEADSSIECDDEIIVAGHEHIPGMSSAWQESTVHAPTDMHSSTNVHATTDVHSTTYASATSNFPMSYQQWSHPALHSTPAIVFVPPPEQYSKKPGTSLYLPQENNNDTFVTQTSSKMLLHLPDVSLDKSKRLITRDVHQQEDQRNKNLTWVTGAVEDNGTINESAPNTVSQLGGPESSVDHSGDITPTQLFPVYNVTDSTKVINNKPLSASSIPCSSTESADSYVTKSLPLQVTEDVTCGLQLERWGNVNKLHHTMGLDRTQRVLKVRGKRRKKLIIDDRTNADNSIAMSVHRNLALKPRQLLFNKDDSVRNQKSVIEMVNRSQPRVPSGCSILSEIQAAVSIDNFLGV